MTVPASSDPISRAQDLLRGYPVGTSEAAVEFYQTRSPEAFDRLISGVLVFHLPRKPEGPPDIATLPGHTKLVADLSVDSLSMVEMSFLLEDLLGAKISDDELRTLVTLDDLRLILRRHAGIA